MNWVDKVLEGRSVRWFMVAVAIYLAYQIWLNARFYGTDWPCWDYMLISGFLGFLGAVSLALDLNRRLDRAIDQLRLTNTLMLASEGVAHLRQTMSERGKYIQVWSGVAIGTLIFGSYVYVFGEFTGRVWQAWRQGLLPEGGVALVELGVFTAISAAAAALAGLFFGRLTHFGTLANVLATDETALRIAPDHFDGACGLKPIGDFYLYQAFLLAIPILWLGAWWAWIIPSYKDVICTVTGQPQFFFAEWREPFLIMWLVVLGYFYTGFIRPFFSLRARIRDVRATLNRDEAVRLEGKILTLQGRLVSASADARSGIAEELDCLARRLWSIRTMRDWPMDSATVTKYRSLIFGEVLLPLGAAALSSAAPGGSDPSALDWLRSLLDAMR